jgi:hypothetical protein
MPIVVQEKLYQRTIIYGVSFQSKTFGNSDIYVKLKITDFIVTNKARSYLYRDLPTDIQLVHYKVTIIDINVVNMEQIQYIVTVINSLILVTGCILLQDHGLRSGTTRERVPLKV